MIYLTLSLIKKILELTSIITGDIINSRIVNAQQWMGKLEKTLSSFGSTPKVWEIYRGDSFQLEVDPIDSFRASLFIKSQIKCIPKLDARIAIGIGEKNYESNKITLSNGPAYIYSGECFDSLSKQNLGIRTPWSAFDEYMNMAFELASLTIDEWTPNSAETIAISLLNEQITQMELADRLGKSQSNISAALKRAGFHTIQKLKRYFEKEIKHKVMNY